jgi:hypothetical protein
VPFLVVALGVGLTADKGKRRTYAATTTAAWLITLTLLLIPLAPFLLPADWAWPLRPDKINTAQLKKVMGSPAESGEMVGRILEEMDTGTEVFVFTRSYALSSLVAFYTPGHPEVTVLGTGSVHGRNHLLWFDPAEHTGENALFVSYKPLASETDFLIKRFEGWVMVAESGGLEKNLVTVVKCYGYKGIR